MLLTRKSFHDEISNNNNMTASYDSRMKCQKKKNPIEKGFST